MVEAIRGSAHTRIVNLGKTNPGLTFFPTSISPCSTRLPSTGAPSSLGHQKALLRCSGNVLLLRRGAESFVASDPMAIVRVRNTVEADGWESKSIACASGHVSVRRRGIGEPKAYESLSGDQCLRIIIRITMYRCRYCKLEIIPLVRADRCSYLYRSITYSSRDLDGFSIK